MTNFDWDLVARTAAAPDTVHPDGDGGNVEYDDYFEEDRRARVRYEKGGARKKSAGVIVTFTSGEGTSSNTFDLTDLYNGNVFVYAQDYADNIGQPVTVDVEGTMFGGTVQPRTAAKDDDLIDWDKEKRRRNPQDGDLVDWSKQEDKIRQDRRDGKGRFAMADDYMDTQITDFVPTQQPFNAGEWTTEPGQAMLATEASGLPIDYMEAPGRPFGSGQEHQPGPQNGPPRDLFPNGIPLRGELTPEQEAWLKRRSSRTAAYHQIPDGSNYADVPLPTSDADVYSAGGWTVRIVKRQGKSKILAEFIPPGANPPGRTSWLNPVQFMGEVASLTHPKSNGWENIYMGSKTADSMFPGAGAQVYRNEAGEPTGWDYPSDPSEYANDDFYDDYAHDDDYEEDGMDREASIRGLGSRMIRREGAHHHHRLAADQISDPQHSWTLNPDDEFWIGNFTDDAIQANIDFWSSEEGRNAQPNLPGYADSMLNMLNAERTRRTGSRRTAGTGIGWGGYYQGMNGQGPSGKGYNVQPDSDGSWKLDIWGESEVSPERTLRGYDDMDDAIEAAEVIEAQQGRTASRQVTAGRPLYEIAQEIYDDWRRQPGGINYAAKPYLEAMMSLNSINDMYGYDSGRGIVAYFLSNAGQYKGEKAKALKNELKAIQKGGAHTAGLFPDEQAAGVTTWADGYGIWHATADNVQEAQRAIRAEIDARGYAGPGYRVRVVHVDGRHYKEAGSLHTADESQPYYDTASGLPHEITPGEATDDFGLGWINDDENGSFTPQDNINDDVNTRAVNGSRTATVTVQGVSLTRVRLDGPGRAKGIAPDGQEIVFRLSPQDEKDLKSILFGDLGMNFSGVDVDESDIITGGEGQPSAEYMDWANRQGSLHTAADGDTSYCRLCGKQLQQMDYAWYALKASPLQRDVGQHYCVPARLQGRPGEFGPDGVLVPGTPGGEGGQYDAPAGTIFDAGGNAIKVGSKTADLNYLSPEDLAAEQAMVTERYVGKRFKRWTDGEEGTAVAAEANAFGGNPVLTVEWDDGVVSKHGLAAIVSLGSQHTAEHPGHIPGQPEDEVGVEGYDPGVMYDPDEYQAFDGPEGAAAGDDTALFEA